MIAIKRKFARAETIKMISWLIVGILVVLGIIAIKMNHLRHRVWILILIFLALFLYVSVTIVYTQYDIELNSTDSVFKAFKIYLGWLGNGFQNLKTLTGQAVKMDWTSSNESVLNKTSSNSKTSQIKK